MEGEVILLEDEDLLPTLREHLVLLKKTIFCFWISLFFQNKTIIFQKKEIFFRRGMKEDFVRKKKKRRRRRHLLVRRRRKILFIWKGEILSDTAKDVLGWSLAKGWVRAPAS